MLFKKVRDILTEKKKKKKNSNMKPKIICIINI